jgi:L-fucose/D-arabinose isomerase
VQFVRLERHPRAHAFATENDALNGATMLFGHLLTNTAQIFADLRTYWSPAAVKRVTGHDPQGRGGRRAPAPDQLRAGRARRHRAAERDGQPAMKPFWDITAEEVKACLAATTWHPSITEYFPGGGWSTRFATRGGMPATIARLNLVKGLGPALQLAEGWTVELPAKVHAALDERTNPTWPTTWFCPQHSAAAAPSATPTR